MIQQLSRNTKRIDTSCERRGSWWRQLPTYGCCTVIAIVKQTPWTVVGLIMVVTAMLLSAGCSQPKSTAPPEPAEFADRRHEFVIDRLARRVEVTGSVSRIVSLAPAITELLFALDLGDHVVGATKHCNYPEQALSIPRIGDGMLESISSEMIVSLKPDLVLCSWDTHQPLVETFERLGVSVCAVGAQSLEELYEETRWIGRLADRNAQAEEFISAMTSRHAELLSVVAEFRKDPPVRVFYEVWDEPLMTAAPNSFIGELLSMAGLENILSDTSVRYPRISSESVIEGNPDLILAPGSHLENIDIHTFKSRPGWSSVSAVANERIYLVSGDQISRCGPRLLDALAEIIRVAYPEAAGALDSESPE